MLDDGDIKPSLTSAFLTLRWPHTEWAGNNVYGSCRRLTGTVGGWLRCFWRMVRGCRTSGMMVSLQRGGVCPPLCPDFFV